MRLFRISCAFAIAMQCAVTVWAADLPGAGADAGKTVIYRDNWGVAHIYAPTAEAGLFAMGWAQAEDRPTELLKNLLRGIGEISSVEGKGGFQSDLVVRMWDLYEGCKRGADKIRPEVRKHTQAFAAGINAYYAKHPEDVPDWWGKRQVDEYMIMSFGRMFLQGWSFDDGFDDMKRAGIEPGTERLPRASNQWAVSPARSATKAPILLIDPHLGWLGMSRFWEFRIHAGDLRGSGFSLPGQMYIALGHNENLAWAMTTGGPDTADVYEETLNNDEPPKYKYDNEWRELTSRKITINIKGEAPKTLTLWSSHHGPIAAFKNGKAYAIKSSYADAVGGNEAWYEFNFGKDYHGAERAMATLQVFPQNVMSADTSGNIYYQRAGRIPKRPEGYDWSKPVDGSTSKSEWLGLHPSTDHVQCLNPPQGYMQNCNVPPDVMMVDSPMSLSKTLPYIWSDIAASPQRDGWTRQRAARAVELLKADNSVTLEEAKAYALDLHPYGIEHWLAVLKKADAKFGANFKSNPDYAAGIKGRAGMERRNAQGIDGRAQVLLLAEAVGGRPRRRGYGRHPQTRGRIDGVGRQGRPRAGVGRRGVVRRSGFLCGGHGQNEGGFRVARQALWRRLPGGSRRQVVALDGNNGDELGCHHVRNIHFSGERPDHTHWGSSGQTSTQLVSLTKRFRAGPSRRWSERPHGIASLPRPGGKAVEPARVQVELVDAGRARGPCRIARGPGRREIAKENGT